MKIRLYVILGIAIMMMMAAYSSAKNIKTDSGADTFFEKARLIMTPEEIDIYKHLPDNASKNQFIDDFWKKRDPDPSTDVNEVKDEFDSRVAYATKWFKEASKGRGWDTERGRILILLGFPDRREWGDARQTYGNQMVTSKRVPMEVWTYYSIAGGLYLIFEDSDDTGKLSLRSIPSNLITAMDLAKFTLDMRDRKELKKAFKFETGYHDGNIDVKIPVKKVSFEEKEGKMGADFGIVVYVYLDGIKSDTVNTQKTIDMSKEEILKLKDFEFTVPYSVQKSGKYYFEIIVEDKNSNMKYRNFASYKK